MSEVMSGKNSGGSQLASPNVAPGDSWPVYPNHEPRPLTDLGLYLYLTFEDESSDEWWPLEDESAIPSWANARPSASKHKFRRNDR